MSSVCNSCSTRNASEKMLSPSVALPLGAWPMVVWILFASSVDILKRSLAMGMSPSFDGNFSTTNFVNSGKSRFASRVHLLHRAL